MEIFVHVPQLFIRHVGVYLGGGDVGVAEEGLDRAKVGAVGEQVGGKAVADDVGGYFFGNSGFYGPLFYHSFHRTGGKAVGNLESQQINIIRSARIIFCTTRVLPSF